MTLFEDHLHKVIAQEGAITIERYMELVLHHPEYGYYRQGNPLAAEGDFLTSPEASPLFGEMVGVWLIEAWHRLGKPKSFVLLELGAGQGTLLRTALDSLENDQDFRHGMKLMVSESNRTLRQIQQNILSSYAVTYCDDIQSLPSLPTIVLANEFFDTLPLRQFVRARVGWRERMVTCANGALRFVNQFRFGLPRNPSVNPLARAIMVGGVYEFSACAATLMGYLSAHIAAHTGAALVIDYGYTAPPPSGTLDALRKHQFVDALSSPGQTDVTAGVDFTVLANIAARHGNMVADLITQREFLEKMGLYARADQVRERLSPEQKEYMHRGLHFIASPTHMGKYKVLEFGCYNGGRK